MDSTIVKDSIVDNDGIKITLTEKTTYPSSFKESDDATDALQKLFIQAVLTSDETDIMDAIRESASRKINSYKTPEGSVGIDSGEKDEVLSVQNYNILQTVVPIYHNHDILCIRKTENTAKDNAPSMSSESFFTFDLEKMERINISDIFSEQDIPAVNNLLKMQLLNDEKCSSIEQLVEIGYFNIEHLSISDEFSLTDTSIEFHYNPYEIACYAIGKTTIRLPLADIKQHIKQSSVLQKIIN